MFDTVFSSFSNFNFRFWIHIYVCKIIFLCLGKLLREPDAKIHAPFLTYVFHTFTYFIQNDVFSPSSNLYNTRLIMYVWRKIHNVFCTFKSSLYSLLLTIFNEIIPLLVYLTFDLADWYHYLLSTETLKFQMIECGKHFLTENLLEG